MTYMIIFPNFTIQIHQYRIQDYEKTRKTAGIIKSGKYIE
jgi:hypothetical protein